MVKSGNESEVTERDDAARYIEANPHLPADAIRWAVESTPLITFASQTITDAQMETATEPEPRGLSAVEQGDLERRLDPCDEALADLVLKRRHR